VAMALVDMEDSDGAVKSIGNECEGAVEGGHDL
jgi:hypothetical protein